MISTHFLGTNTSWPCHEDDDDGANSDTKTVNSDLEDDGPDIDSDILDEYPDIDYDESELKTDTTDDPEKCHTKSGESLQSSLWINPNERDIEDLKKLVKLHLFSG